MVTGEGNYRPIEAEDLLAQLSDSDDSLEAGMDTGELDEVSFICESGDNDDNGGNGDEDNWSVAGSIGHYNPSLPGPSTAPVSSSEDLDSSDGDSGDLSDFTDSTSGEEEIRTKRPRKPTKKWKKGSKFVPKPIKVFDDLNVGIQVPYKLPVDAKEVEYFKLYFDGKLVGDKKSETNRYAEQLLASSTACTKTLRDWVRTTELMNYMLFCYGYIDGCSCEEVNKGLLVN